MIKGIGRSKRKLRNETILVLRGQSKTLDEIGQEYGLTRERVRQIINQQIKGRRK